MAPLYPSEFSIIISYNKYIVNICYSDATVKKPKVGFVLHALFDEVIEDPSKNNREYLEGRAVDLMRLPIEELKDLGKKGKEEIKEKGEEQIKDIRKQFNVS